MKQRATHWKILALALTAGLITAVFAAGSLLPIRTEVFQEVSIDDMDGVPDGVTNLLSIKVDPISDREVKYTVVFDSAAEDQSSLEDRVAYQDLMRMHIFDFYNCYSFGKIDGIAIRRHPVSAVDRKVYQGKEGTYVLRLLFNCEDDATTRMETEGNTVSIYFKSQRTVSPAATERVARKKSGKKPYVQMSKKVLVGLSATALAGAAATYFVGRDQGIDKGIEDAKSLPEESNLPTLPSNEEAFPPSN